MIRTKTLAAAAMVLMIAGGACLAGATEASAQTSARYNAARDACLGANNARAAAEQAAGRNFSGPRGEDNLQRMIDAGDDSLRRDIQDARESAADARARGRAVSAAVWDEVICYGEALLRTSGSGGAPVAASPEPAAPSKVAIPSAAYQKDGDCIHMDNNGPQGSTWQVVSTCSYRAFGSFCYDDDGPFSCAMRAAGGFGPLAPKGRNSIGTSPRNGAGYRISWCDYEDWTKGTCGKFEPWTEGAQR